MYQKQNKTRQTSWQGVAKWYNNIVGEKGMYFHTNVIIPKSLEILKLTTNDNLLDLACGQGVFAKYIPKNMQYHGIDLAPDLIKYAKSQNTSANIQFSIANLSEQLHLNIEYSHIICILAIQNIENLSVFMQNISRHLKNKGRFLIVMNHPHFRIPRQTAWGIDENRKIQYRRIDLYKNEIKIPITMNPGGKNDLLTWSFRRPLEQYIKELKKANLLVDTIDEWTSPKQSEGKASKMENRARNEIPMFMAISGIKLL